MKGYLLILMFIISFNLFSEVNPLKEKRYDKKINSDYKVITGVIVSSVSKEFSIFIEKEKRSEFFMIINIDKLSSNEETEFLNYARENSIEITQANGRSEKIEIGDVAKAQDLNERVRAISFKNGKAREKLISMLKENKELDMVVTLKNIRFRIEKLNTEGFKEYYENDKKIMLNYSTIREIKKDKI